MSAACSPIVHARASDRKIVGHAAGPSGPQSFRRTRLLTRPLSTVPAARKLSAQEREALAHILARFKSSLAPECSAGDLARRLGVSLRTARRYIAEIRSAGLLTAERREGHPAHRLGTGPLVWQIGPALTPYVLVPLRGDMDVTPRGSSAPRHVSGTASGHCAAEAESLLEKGPDNSRTGGPSLPVPVAQLGPQPELVRSRRRESTPAESALVQRMREALAGRHLTTADSATLLRVARELPKAYWPLAVAAAGQAACWVRARYLGASVRSILAALLMARGDPLPQTWRGAVAMGEQAQRAARSIMAGKPAHLEQAVPVASASLFCPSAYQTYVPDRTPGVDPPGAFRAAWRTALGRPASTK
jgi:DNA-binding transcriptional ArsR family regulator